MAVAPTRRLCTRKRADGGGGDFEEDRIRQSAYVGLTRQQLDDIIHERERQRDRLEAAAAAADWSVEIAQSYVVPAFERGA